MKRVVDHLLFLFLGPVPSFYTSPTWLYRGSSLEKCFDIDIYPLVSVIIFYFLRFPLNIPFQSTRNSSFSFTTNPLSLFDYDPFNIPDTRSLYRVSLTYLSSIDRFEQSRHQYRSSIDTDLPSIPPSIPPSKPIFHRYRHRYRSSIDTTIDTDLPSLPIFHRYRHRYQSSIDTAIDADLPSIPSSIPPSIPIFHRYRSSIDTDLPSIPPSIPIFHSITILFFATLFCYPILVSGFVAESIVSIRGYESIRANNFKFSKSILPLFTVLFTGKVQFGG